MSRNKFTVLGSGKQGIAAAYDLIKIGNAKEVRLLDLNIDAAVSGANRINTLLKCDTTISGKLDVTNHSDLVKSLEGVDVFISTVPYHGAIFR